MASAMQFWGVDVKAKEPCKVSVREGQIIHVSQATLGEVKKDNEHVTVHVKVGTQKLVLGMLSQNSPQLPFDLVFDEDFEISHNWKNGSVHILGYQSEYAEDSDFSEFSDEEAVLPVIKENGKSAAAALAAKASGKPVAAAKANKDIKPKSEENESDEDGSDDDEDDSDSDDLMLGSSDESGEEEDDSEDEDDSEEETPAKADVGKKRPNADAKTPEPKKAKVVTPQKTDSKKGPHSATPHPSKKSGKTPAGDKSTPKSAGSQVSCGSCKKTFNSDKALESHSKAKHAAK